MPDNPTLSDTLLRELKQKASQINVPKGVEIIRQGEYVKGVPVVTKGLIKVMTQTDGRDLLLYYIQPGESCIMSFSSVVRGAPSEVLAIAEEDTEVVVLPAQHLQLWLKEYIGLSDYFYQLHYARYHELIRTIQHLLYDKLDSRLSDYLKQKSERTSSAVIHSTHQQIAADLGSSREVISRLLKKLERDGKIVLHPGEIKILHL